MDVPPFDERHAIRFTTFRIRADRKLDETGGVLLERYQNFQRLASLAGKIAVDRIRVVGRRPQRIAHAPPGVSVVGFGWPYEHAARRLYLRRDRHASSVRCRSSHSCRPEAASTVTIVTAVRRQATSPQ